MAQDHRTGVRGASILHNEFFLAGIEKKLIRQYGDDWQEKVKRLAEEAADEHSKSILAVDSALNAFAKSADGRTFLKGLESGQAPPTDRPTLFAEYPSLERLMGEAKGIAAPLGATAPKTFTLGLGGQVAWEAEGPRPIRGRALDATIGVAYALNRLDGCGFLGLEGAFGLLETTNFTGFLQGGLWWDDVSDLAGPFVGAMVRIIPSMRGGNVAVYWSAIDFHWLGFAVGLDVGHQIEVAVTGGYTLTWEVV